MHARELLNAGFDVVQFEVDAAPMSASVRNFGLVWVSGRRPGPELAAATRARELWELIASEIPGVGFRPEGSLTVAMEPDERKLMEEFAASDAAQGRRTRFIEPAEVRVVNPAVHSDTLGALWCEQDAIVEPRLALGAIREHLSASSRYEFCPGKRIVEADSNLVRDQFGQLHSADVVILALGAVHSGVWGDHLAEAPLRRVRLQMLQTYPHAERLTTSIADADSMRYYPAYEGINLSLLRAPNAVSEQHKLQLLLVQRADGGLTIGDSHLYDEPFDFDLDEAPSDELLGRAERLLGCPLPGVARRWEGVYSQSTDPDQLWYRKEVASGVWIVTGPGGRGMTCAPAIAEETMRVAGLTP
jgi:FAD dependent oxidoreductase TIGR03364